MNNRRFLLILALGLILAQLFAVPATAGSLLECKGELPGGYTFTGPEEVPVSIYVRNAGDEDFPGPVELYYPDLTLVEEFGSPALAAGSSRNWVGTWKVTQKELEEGVIAFYVRYPVKDESTGEVTTKAKKLTFRITYSNTKGEISQPEFEYILRDDGTAEITSWSGNAEELVIPEELDGYQVTGIVMTGNEKIKKITIPRTVFRLHTTLFLTCTGLESVYVSPDSPYMASIDGVLFGKPNKKLICYPRSKTSRQYTIPNGILSIADGAFSDCKSLEKVTVPDSMESIGKDAFAGCSSLKEINIPGNVKSIGDGAFRNCASLTGMVLPDGITAIGADTFSNCGNLLGITIPYSVTSIGSRAFCKCQALHLITIPHGLKSIGEKAFSDCSALQSILLPDSLTSIADDAFEGCKNLTVLVDHDSYAAEYCWENGIVYTYTDALDWLNN